MMDLAWPCNLILKSQNLDEILNISDPAHTLRMSGYVTTTRQKSRHDPREDGGQGIDGVRDGTSQV